MGAVSASYCHGPWLPAHTDLLSSLLQKCPCPESAWGQARVHQTPG